MGISIRNGRTWSLKRLTSGHYEEALKFYRDTFGAREAFSIRNPDGTARLAYLQLSRDTFVEIVAAGADQQSGVTHFGIETDDVAASVANLRARGFKVDDPVVGGSKARVARIADPDGVQIDIMQFGPESLQRQAIDSWR
jgi:catechol 2,3-dioxygenase-like lactoylglutathione lyase family enzyme